MKFHIVWTPKYRGKVLTSEKIRSELRRIFESLCKWKHWEIIELSIQDDHIHLCILITTRFYIVCYANTERQVVRMDEEEN